MVKRMVWIPETEYNNLLGLASTSGGPVPFSQELQRLHSQLQSILDNNSMNKETKAIKIDQLFKNMQKMRNAIEDHPPKVVVKNSSSALTTTKQPSPPPPKPPSPPHPKPPSPPSPKKSPKPNKKTPKVEEVNSEDEFSTPQAEPAETPRSRKTVFRSLDEKVNKIRDYLKTNYPEFLNESGQVLNEDGTPMARGSVDKILRYMLEKGTGRAPPGYKRLNKLLEDTDFINLASSPVQSGRGKTIFKPEKWKF